MAGSGAFSAAPSNAAAYRAEAQRNAARHQAARQQAQEAATNNTIMRAISQ